MPHSSMSLPTTEYIQAGFDYSQLDPDVRERVQESDRVILENLTRASESILVVGREISRVKLEDLDHGQFLDWLKHGVRISQPTASRFMSVARAFNGKSIQAEYFEATALYALSSSNVPEDLRKEFIQVAESGHKVTHSEVQEAIRERRAEPVPVQEWDEEPQEAETDFVPLVKPGETVRMGSTTWYTTDARPPNVHVSNNSGENEWYTPAQFIAAAREVMGDIDLDPASSDKANETVNATTYYTKEDNGLAQPWYGRVWLNPPYAQPLISHFAEKVVQEVAEGNVSEAIVLVNNATETRSWQLMADSCTAVCFPRGRIRYLDATGTPANTPLQGQTFVYFGKYRGRFYDVFMQFGVVL